MVLPVQTRQLIADSIRDFIFAFGAIIGWFASVKVFDEGWRFWVAFAFASLSWLAAIYQAYVRFGPIKIDFELKPPRPSKSGSEDLNRILVQIYEALRLPASAEVRLTLFVPDSRRGQLIQMARYQWTKSCAVSRTRIRIGACAVGHAYNTRRLWYVSNVDDYGGFEQSLIWCGLTRDEARAQIQQGRVTFAAIPLLCTKRDSAEEMVVGVISVDAGVARCLPSALHTIVLEHESSIVGALLPGLSYMPVAGKRSSEVLTEAGQRSEKLLAPKALVSDEVGRSS